MTGMQATRCQNTYNINIFLHTLHHVSDAGKSVCIATASKLLCTLKAHIAKSHNLRMINLLLNSLYVLFGYGATSDKGESFLVHAFSLHVLQTTVKIQKIFLVCLPAKLI